jgi:formylglycine-generating enzyme required for sulfatase activity
MPHTQGQILHDRYRIVRLLGQGGFGAVYRAWDLTLDRPCAVKESFELSPQGQRQFVFEARILGRLSHPNLPRVSDYFTLPGQGQYLVMDYVEGHDLEELRAQAGGRLPAAQVLPWIAQVCEALEYLHSQQPAVIHRDIKPANIKITPPDRGHPGGRAMLVDFGVAKVYDPAMRTTMGARAVTPGYSPHEQYGQSQAATDARTDIYALGATLYTLLTGQEPPESILRILTDPLQPPRQIVPAISPAVEAAILKAMQMDPGRRFQSAGEFSGQLAGGGGQAPVVTQPPGGPVSPSFSPATMGMPLARTARRFPWKGVGLGAGVLVGLGLLAVVIGLLSNGLDDTRLTETSQARGTQTAAALSALLSVTPPSPTATHTRTPTATLIPSSDTPISSPAPILGIGATQISPVDGMVMSYIPAGTFLMGSEDGDSDERPVHSVTLDAFWMDQTEVTNGMYAQCVAVGDCTQPEAIDSNTRSGYYGDADYASYPVIHVNWYQAQAYCNWAGRRLPTEAEWEYAARGGLVGAIYPWGDEDPSCTLGAQNGAQYNACNPYDTILVGSFASNGYSLYDMAGNVWEWVADWYGSYSSAAVENPVGPATGDYRVNRGGAWDYDVYPLQVFPHSGNRPDSAFYNLGFRCALPTEAVDAPASTPLPPTLISTPASIETQVSLVDGMVMSYIPAGTFLMGSDSGEDDEQPVHSVTLDAFWMDQTEVTNGMYAQCVTAGACSPPDNTYTNTRSSYYGDPVYADYPVIYVDWNQASTYCAWAGRQLPTEAQWEYAARGGLVGSAYPWGNEAPNCMFGAQNGAQYASCSPDDTILVGSFAPNGYGLYDMAGNVWEWVADWYSEDYYSNSPIENPTGPASGVYRVVRGGSWSNVEFNLRVSYCGRYSPDGTYLSIGFRCASSP